MKTLSHKIKKAIPLIICCFALALCSFWGCTKLVEVDPPTTKITNGNVYTSDQTAAAVLTGIYTWYASSSPFLYLPVYTGLSADELVCTSAGPSNYLSFYSNNLLANNINPDYWSILYGGTGLYAVNSAIEGLSASNSLTPAIKQQLTGEAKFLRAYFYFYLINIYGDVPLVTTTDYKQNALLSRTPKSQVIAQIISDLTDAQNLLSTSYLDGTLLKTSPDRVRPTKWSADALLARVYLYNNDYVHAESYSSMLIGNTAQFGLSAMNNVFLKASSGNNEAIWQMPPTSTQNLTIEPTLYIIPPSGPGNDYPLYLNNNLINAFEAGDQRSSDWVGNVTVGAVTYYYAYKYKNNVPFSAVTEHEMILRLGEQYLIRAEAQANNAGGGLSAAIADLNVIRNRAGLPNYTGPANKDAVLRAILHERQVELFTEGHRWFDLKRTGTIDGVMSIVTPQKGGTWSSSKALYPIPQYDILHDKNIVQNPGY